MLQNIFNLSLLLPLVISQNVYNLSGKPDGGYYLQMNIGTPSSQFNILLDTGSSNFAVAAYKDPNITKYFDSSHSTSFKSQGRSIDVDYTQGHWKGSLGSDQVSLPGGTNYAVTAEIALIEKSENFFENGSDWQGILGLGYADLTVAATDSYKPLPYFDTLVNQAGVANGFSMLLCGAVDSPLSNDVAMGGKLTVGAIDDSQYKGDLYKATVVRDGYYKLVITDIKVDDNSLSLDCVSYNTEYTILDSGTTNLRLPVKVFDIFIDKLKKSVREIPSYANITLDNDFWSGHNAVCTEHASAMFNSFPTVSLDLLHDPGQTITLYLAPQQYMRPVESTQPDRDCYQIGVTSSDLGTVLGAVVMEGFYVYFDRENNSALFGETSCRPHLVNITRSTVTGYLSTSLSLQSCLYKPPSSMALPIYAIVLIAVAAFLISFLLIVAIAKLVSKFMRSRRRTRSDIAFDELVDDSFDTGY